MKFACSNDNRTDYTNTASAEEPFSFHSLRTYLFFVPFREAECEILVFSTAYSVFVPSVRHSDIVF